MDTQIIVIAKLIFKFQLSEHFFEIVNIILYNADRRKMSFSRTFLKVEKAT